MSMRLCGAMVQDVMMRRREETVDPHQVLTNVYGELAAPKRLLVEDPLLEPSEPPSDRLGQHWTERLGSCGEPCSGEGDGRPVGSSLVASPTSAAGVRRHCDGIERHAPCPK
jgi:hypothetical protein